MVNFLWGSFNLAVGAALLIWKPLIPAFDLPTVVFAVGFLLSGLLLAYHFGEVQRARGKSERTI